MSGELCRGVFNDGPEIERAVRLDAAYPSCACEPWSLTAAGGDGVPPGEIVARILTSPDQYSEETSTILTAKLTHIHSLGLSFIRQGASDAEILSTINELTTKASEARNLIGAVVVGVAKLREYANDDDRWFGVYATDDRGKLHHVDLLGTTPPGGGNAVKKSISRRRHKLAEDMLPLILFEDDAAKLLTKLRAAGI